MIVCEDLTADSKQWYVCISQLLMCKTPNFPIVELIEVYNYFIATNKNINEFHVLEQHILGKLNIEFLFAI